MKHFSANLEQSVTVDNGDLTITAGDSLIIANTSKTGADRAIQLEGTATEFVDGTGAIVSNDSFNAVAFNAMTGVLTLSRVDGTTAGTVTISTGTNTNDTAGRIPIAVTAADGYTGTAEEFADSSLSQTVANGLVTAGNGLAVTGALTVSTTATITGNLTTNGDTVLGDTGADSVTIPATGGSGQGIVVSSATGVLSRITSIPEAFLPNITIGDVFTYQSEATTKAAAETAFYAETEHYEEGATVSGRVYPEQPYHRGDIAIISYDINDDNTYAGTSVLIYVGANQGAGTAGTGLVTFPASNAADWHDISISATGIMDINVTAPVTSTGGTTPTIGVTTGAVVDGGAGLSTQDQIFDFVTGRMLALNGDVVAAATALGTGTTTLSTALQPNTVDVSEINAAIDAVPGNDAGKVLTLNDTGTGLEWTTNGAGTVNKITDTFTTATSTAIDISALGNGGYVTVQVYEVSTGSLNQIIPDSVVINNATVGSETVTIAVGVAPSGSVTAYRYVITG